MNINKKRIIVIVAIALILVGGVVAFTIWRIQDSYRAVNESQNSQKNGKQYSADQRQALIDEVNRLYSQKDYTGAIALIEGQQNIEDVNTQLILAGAYANSDNLSKAYDVYKKLDQAHKLPDVEIANMADMAERSGDFKGALALYKRAKEYAVSSKTETEDQIAFYDYKISQLEKK